MSSDGSNVDPIDVWKIEGSSVPVKIAEAMSVVAGICTGGLPARSVN